MKISDPNPHMIGVTSPNAVPPNAAHTRGSAGETHAADRAQLSNFSSHLAWNSPAHLERLSHLTAVVSSGSYHVDPHTVSHAIVEDSLRYGRARL